MGDLTLSQLTLDGAAIPIKARDPETQLTPAEREIWYYLKGIGPRTEKEIHLQPAFTKYSTIGNKLRSMRKKEYARSIPQHDGSPQKWEAR